MVRRAWLSGAQPVRVIGEARACISVAGVSCAGSAAWVTISKKPPSWAAAALIAGSACDPYLPSCPSIPALSQVPVPCQNSFTASELVVCDR